MDASAKGDLTSRLDGVIEVARVRVKAFQAEAEKAHREVRDRFQKFIPIAEQIPAMAREKLERLRGWLKFDVTPAHAQTDRFYERSVRIDAKSELAGVIKLSFGLTHDSDVSQVLHDYDLEIIPVFFRFDPHARQAIPLEAYDEAAAAGWLDDRLVDFANAYLEFYLTKQYQERVPVPDTVAGISVPKYYAASTLEREGKTYYFISDETRREFEKQRGLTP
jgi:YHS domain-containing protein